MDLPSRLSSIRLSTCARQRVFDDSADDKTRLTCQFQAHARPCRPFDTQVPQSLSPRFLLVWRDETCPNYTVGCPSKPTPKDMRPHHVQFFTSATSVQGP